MSETVSVKDSGDWNASPYPIPNLKALSQPAINKTTKLSYEIAVGFTEAEADAAVARFRQSLDELTRMELPPKYIQCRLVRVSMEAVVEEKFA